MSLLMHDCDPCLVLLIVARVLWQMLQLTVLEPLVAVALVMLLFVLHGCIMIARAHPCFLLRLELLKQYDPFANSSTLFACGGWLLAVADTGTQMLLRVVQSTAIHKYHCAANMWFNMSISWCSSLQAAAQLPDDMFCMHVVHARTCRSSMFATHRSQTNVEGDHKSTPTPTDLPPCR